MENRTKPETEPPAVTTPSAVDDLVARARSWDIGDHTKAESQALIRDLLAALESNNGTPTAAYEVAAGAGEGNVPSLNTDVASQPSLTSPHAVPVEAQTVAWRQPSTKRDGGWVTPKAGIAEHLGYPTPAPVAEPPVSDAEVSALEGRMVWRSDMGDEFDALNHYTELARDAIALLRRRTAGAGWKLVPVEPTPEQFHAYFTAFVARMKRYPTDPVTDPQRRDCFAEGYRAMLAAAPPAAGEGKS